MKFVKTPGIERVGCKDWKLTISIVIRLFKDKEHFISFEPRAGRKTRITDGNENELAIVDKLLFPDDVKVWAIYGDDEENEYYTFLLPEEY
ncbi:hypothetical protein PCCS19_21220 [Paenibacillus sp. CCS19]|uniref:hypothetical protein n=1 Tax=Paenibacillus sp. CCS19 TaxID=3158387 RepID=UPI00256624FA|nr:hypothetical protein [Paenibacillus cellulosilyticus]GMK39068.1 hypothetical protein PCCS19_21220 [Paenibacillus cellulosilyticus]